MNLQEKHFEAIENNIEIEGSQYVDAEKSAESSAKITKDYMKRFTEWKDENYVTGVLYNKYVTKDDYYSIQILNTCVHYTIDELINIFLQNENQNP